MRGHEPVFFAYLAPIDAQRHDLCENMAKHNLFLLFQIFFDPVDIIQRNICHPFLFPVI